MREEITFNSPGETLDYLLSGNTLYMSPDRDVYLQCHSNSNLVRYHHGGGVYDANSSHLIEDKYWVYAPFWRRPGLEYPIFGLFWDEFYTEASLDFLESYCSENDKCYKTVYGEYYGNFSPLRVNAEIATVDIDGCSYVTNKRNLTDE